MTAISLFQQKLVHLDFKGAPPKVAYLCDLFPRLKAWGATGVCLEWEDMLPFEGPIAVIRNAVAYSRDEVDRLLTAARKSELSVVPLVQTFGHLEFMLRHDEFAGYREDPSSTADLCPFHPGAGDLIRAYIDQVIEMHPGIQTLHLGGDEVWSLGTHPATRQHIEEHGKPSAFLHHMVPLFEHVRARGLQALFWDDMIRSWPVEALTSIGKRAAPVVWTYRPNVATELPPDLWTRYEAAGILSWAASAFKGADGTDTIWPIGEDRIANHASWIECARQTPVEGIILTGWSRHNYYAVLCALLPAGLPTLALALRVLETGPFDDAMRRDVFESLGIGDMPFVHNTTEAIQSIPVGTFPGAEIFSLVGVLQGARQLVRRAAEQERCYIPPANGGRRDPGRAELIIEKTRQALEMAASIRPRLRRALRQQLLQPDADEFVAVHVNRLMREARRIQRVAEKVLQG
ncbi:MAG: beta-N-acetylhexosaminidase [Verrucomicrobia bacterium]|nr:beta-N-acetylhexosaminidase [Verrucomicrobiota bacterium]